MGCFGSRFSKRADAVSLLTNGLQFVGGESHEHNGCPVDFFVFRKTAKQTVEEKEVQVPEELQAQFPTAEFKATNKEITEAIYIATHKEVSALLAKHEEEKAKNNKDPLVGGRYKLSDAIKQLTDVIAAFAASAIEIPAAAPTGQVAGADGGTKEVDAGAGAAGAGDGADNDDVQNMGGENEGEGDGAGAGDDAGAAGAGDADANAGAGAPSAPAKMDPGVYSSDAYDYAGWEQVPAIFLKQATVNPYFGDLVKGHIIDHEFLRSKSKAETFNGAAGLITSALSSATRVDTETWFSGVVGDEDLGGLQSITKDGPILFPGWIAGWKSEAEAISHLDFIGLADATQKVNKVVFHVTGASIFEFVQCRLFAHRLEGTVASNKDDAGICKFEVTAKPHNDATIAEWVASKAKVVKDNVPVVVADPNANKDVDPEGAGDNAEAEGKGAGDAPAENAE